MGSVPGRSIQSLEGMSRRARIAVSAILIFGAVGASALFIVGIASHLGCGTALAYDYDIGACELPTEHPSSKGYAGTVIAGIAALAMGAAGVILLARSRLR